MKVVKENKSDLKNKMRGEDLFKNDTKLQKMKSKINKNNFYIK